GYGTCDSSTHTCACNLGYEGDACEFLNYDSLEAFICGELASESGLVTLHEGTSLTCTAEGDISVSDLCNIATLDLSTSGLTSIAGLSSMCGLEELHLDDLEFASEATSSVYLSELSDLPLEILPIDNTNIVLNATVLANIPSDTLNVLSAENVSIPAGTDFSAFEVLEKLDVSNNDMFTISSSAVFPDSLTSLDISGCTSIASLSSLPTDLTSLSLAGLTLTDSSISLLATYTLLE
ncbi:hypothetical protein ADUPG1_002869, partial [Aduncisulcus paluster]